MFGKISFSKISYNLVIEFIRQTKNEIFNEVDLNAPNFICDKNTLGVIDVKFNSQGKCKFYFLFDNTLFK